MRQALRWMASPGRMVTARRPWRMDTSILIWMERRARVERWFTTAKDAKWGTQTRMVPDTRGADWMTRSYGEECWSAPTKMMTMVYTCEHHAVHRHGICRA